MTHSNNTQITVLLKQLRENAAPENWEALTVEVYETLRRMAQAKMRRERAGHTLQPTALVHEAFFKISADENPSFEDRNHFFSACALAMRNILVDHARRKRANKRGAGAEHVSLEGVQKSTEDPEELLALDLALTHLAETSPRQAEVVHLHYFLGLTVEETAEILGVSKRTVDEDWKKAKAALQTELSVEDSSVRPSVLDSTPKLGHETVGHAGETYFPYEVGHEIGRGGMGVVHKGLDKRLNRPVALKFLNTTADLGDEQKLRLQHEASTLAQFNHPAIASIYAMDETDHGQLFLVLEWVSGTTLAERLSQGTLDLKEACQLFEGLISALTTTHKVGFAHGDLKPENIMIDSDGKPRLLDYGLARALESPNPGRGEIWGTPGYMSPEQWKGNPASELSDVFALGTILWECLCGEKLFSRDSFEETKKATLTFVPNFDTLPAEIRKGVVAAVSREPAARRSALHDLRVAIQSVLHPSGRVTTTKPSHNLPASSTPFVGRRIELQSLPDLIRNSRLLTLHGPGGSGKTRLTMEVCHQLKHDYADGIWSFDFSEIASLDQLEGLILRTLSLREKPDQGALETLVSSAQEHRSLWIFDNCEHVLDECARIINQVLVRCPDITILATSREPLGLSGEQKFPVPSLSMTATDQEPNSEAVQLFVSRAKAADPDFLLSDQTRDAVISICRQLEGLPLAIELAAARVSAMSVHMISERLKDHLEDIAQSRTPVERHRSLRAAFNWSYELLDVSEQALLCRASLFESGWNLTHLEYVVADNHVIQQSQVFGILTALIEKSLIVRDASQKAEGRYRMLETQKQFATEHLSTKDRHRFSHRLLRTMINLVEEARRGFQGTDQAKWTRTMDLEHGNALVALEWAHQQGFDEDAWRLASALTSYWFQQSQFETAVLWETRLLESPTAEVSSETKRKLYLGFGLIASERTDYVKAKKLLSIAYDKGSVRDATTATTLRTLGVVATREDRHDEARKHFTESLALNRSVPDADSEVRTLIFLGNLAITQGEYERAMKIYAEVISEHWDSMSDFFRTAILGDDAYLSNYAGDFERSADYASRSRVYAKKAKVPAEIARGHINLGRSLFYSGDLEGARTNLTLAVKLTQSLDHPFYRSFASSYLLDCLLAIKEDPKHLEEVFTHAFAACRVPAGRCSLLTRGAEVALLNENHQQALSRSQEATQILEGRDCIEGSEERTYWVRAHVALALEDRSQALDSARKAMREVQRKADNYETKSLRDQYWNHPESRAVVELIGKLEPGRL